MPGQGDHEEHEGRAKRRQSSTSSAPTDGLSMKELQDGIKALSCYFFVPFVSFEVTPPREFITMKSLIFRRNAWSWTMQWLFLASTQQEFPWYGLA